MELFTFLSAGFWLNFFWFLVAFFFSIFLPGFLIIEKTHSLKDQKTILILSPVLGISLFAFQGYIFGYLGLRWLTYFYLLFFAFWAIQRRQVWFEFFKKFKPKKIKNTLKHDRLALSIITLGVITQIFPVFLSGWLDQNGLGFYFLNAFDGVLHLSFIESIKNHFPPIQPGAWNLPISNYHYWSDLLMAEFARVWHLPVVSIYFHFFPPLISSLLGLLVYQILIVWTGSKKAGLLALILYYFAGDFTYIFSFIINHTFGENIDVIDNGVLQFINTPQAFAKLIFFASILLFSHWLKKKQLTVGIILAILISSLFGFKIYFGIFALFGLGLVLLYWLIISAYQTISSHVNFKHFFSKNRQILLVALIVLLLSLIVFIPTNKGAGGLFWVPLTWPKLFIAAHKMNWNEWWLRMQVYQAANNTKALIVFNGLLLGVFLTSVFNFRLLGLLAYSKLPAKIRREILLFLLVPTVVCSFIGINFLQTSGGHNVFNFFVVSLAALNLFVPMLIVQFPKKPIINLLITLLFLLSLPRSVLLLKGFGTNYLDNTDKQTISFEEIEALKFLKNQSDRGLILQNPKNFLNSQTPYTYFLSDKFSYLSGTGILLSHNQPIEERKALTDYIFAATDSAKIVKLMTDKNIEYIYLKKAEEPAFMTSTISAAANYFKTIFKNQEITIITAK